MVAAARFTIRAFLILSDYKQHILTQRNRRVNGYEVKYFHVLGV